MKTVKEITLLLFSFAFCLLMACSKKEKEAPDTREQFLGTWKGVATIKVEAIGSTQEKNDSVTIVVTKKANTSDKLTLASAPAKGTSIGSLDNATATVNGNALTLDEVKKNADIYNQTIAITMNGTGAVNGNTMTLSGTMKYQILTTISSPWSMNLTKQ